jgi:hypothetical protein
LREDGKLGILCDKAWWLIGLSDGKPVTQLKIPGDCQVLTDAPSPVYVTTGGLRCFSQDGRKEQWKLKANLTTDGLESVFYTKSTIVMPTKDKGIIGVDIDNCTTRWQIPMPKASPAIPSPSLKYLALPNGKDLRLIEISQRL